VQVRIPTLKPSKFIAEDQILFRFRDDQEVDVAGLCSIGQISQY
jgi:hypothetical protein